jgi:hypothetical protein
MPEGLLELRQAIRCSRRRSEAIVGHDDRLYCDRADGEQAALVPLAYALQHPSVQASRLTRCSASPPERRLLLEQAKCDPLHYRCTGLARAGYPADFPPLRTIFLARGF